jgi:hypothetical protein
VNWLNEKSISSIGGFRAKRINFYIDSTALSWILLCDKFKFKITGVAFMNSKK